jgi:hypothetical protein
MISCICPNCYVEIEFHIALAGYTIPCPQCDEWIRVPGTKRPWHNPEPMGKRWIELRTPAQPEPTEATEPPRQPPEPKPPSEPAAPKAELAPLPEAPKIRCQCPFCNSILRVQANLADKETTCPACKGRLIVPQAPNAAPEAPAARPEHAPSWKVSLPPRPRRRRRRRERERGFDAGEQSARYDEAVFERGRTLALVIVVCLLALTVLDVISLIRMLPGTTRKFQPTEAEYLYIYLAVLGALIAVRVICLFGMLTAQNWARMTLGMLLFMGGLCGIFTIVKDNALLGAVQMLLNLSFGTIILCSSSLASYTRG